MLPATSRPRIHCGGGWAVFATALGGVLVIHVVTLIAKRISWAHTIGVLDIGWGTPESVDDHRKVGQ